MLFRSDKLFGSNPFYAQVKDDIELLQEAGNEFSEEAILAGKLTPVFFGSTLSAMALANEKAMMLNAKLGCLMCIKSLQ